MKKFRDFLKEVREMPLDQAHAVFKKHGVNTMGMSIDGIKGAHRKLMQKLHPDAGGKPGEAGEVNAAMDAIKKGGSGSTGSSGHYEAPDQGYKHPARWAQAGHSGGMPNSDHISRHDFRDVNFIKKTFHDKAQARGEAVPKQEHTIHQYDGNFFRHTFTTFGHKDDYPEMADAMRTWGSSGNPYHTKAVFASTKADPKGLHMIWANGKHVNPPIRMEHDSFNLNPGNDQSFVNNLSHKIDRATETPEQKNARLDAFEKDLRPTRPKVQGTYKNSKSKPKVA
jgi:hypothetical protein